MGIGGRAGAGGAGGASGGNLVDGVACMKNSFGECFKDSWIMIACYSQAAQDCITNRPGTACPNQDRSLPMEQQGLTTDEYFTLGGAPGTMYRVTLRVNGVSEGKYYEMGTRAAGSSSPNVNDPNGIDGWYTGGRPVDFENYNIYRLTVRGAPTNPAMPESGAEVAHYYLNSMPAGTGTNYEQHNTFPFGYTHDVAVPGGGVIQYHTADRNCHAIDNCGPGSRSTSCAVTDGRAIPNEPNVMIPAMYMNQPVSGINLRNANAQPFHAQILHITVTNVVAM
jgi:hypothetical protein